MNQQQLQKLLAEVKDGTTAIDEAVAQLRRMELEHLEFATIDHHRAIRCGFPEVIFAPGKTSQQILEIARRLADNNDVVLISRTEPDVFAGLQAAFPGARYNPQGKMVTIRRGCQPAVAGCIAICTAGTGDIPVAEEAVATAEAFDARIEKLYDVGVAGLHRLLNRIDTLQSANAIVVIAGMEGALASVVCGLVSKPVIAVPTSIGYGANFEGVAPLLTMLNSCAAGVSVVNIDNGFAAGYNAALINRMAVGATGQ